MIKLFWNTHNQKKPSSEYTKIKEKQARDYNWGIYHKKFSNKWIYEILKKIKYVNIEDEKNLKKDDILVIVDSNVEEKKDFYSKLNLACSKGFF